MFLTFEDKWFQIRELLWKLSNLILSYEIKSFIIAHVLSWIYGIVEIFSVVLKCDWRWDTRRYGFSVKDSLWQLLADTAGTTCLLRQCITCGAGSPIICPVLDILLY